jgi:hypothetical protein
MLDARLFCALEAVWPPPRRGFFATVLPQDVTFEVSAALRGIAVTCDGAWSVNLLCLALRAAGTLRDRVLDTSLAVLERVPIPAWTWLDEFARSEWYASNHAPPGPDGTWPDTEFRTLLREGKRQWSDAPSLDAIRDRLGTHAAALVFAAMHRNGRVRQAAVVALAADPRALPALLLRANDWVRPVRDDALQSLHGLVETASVESWLRALPLLVRLEGCGRAAHGALLDRVGARLRDPAARASLLSEIGAPDLTKSRAAAAMALRTFGGSDREVVAALLRCPDTSIRVRAVDPTSSALDGDLLDLALRDPVASMRRRALDVLRARRAADFVARLRSACFDRSAAVREYALFHLRSAGRLDATALAAEARERIAVGGDMLGPAGLLCDLDADAPADLEPLCGHASGRVRLLVKARLLGKLRDGVPVDPRLRGDASPKVVRALVPHLRSRGIEPDAASLVRAVEESVSDSEACAWLRVLAHLDVWDALPCLVRAMDDRRPVVAEHAAALVGRMTKRTLRSYADPGAARLEWTAVALRSCRASRAAPIVAWVRAATGRRDWTP